jgi:hypothetical protein
MLAKNNWSFAIMPHRGSPPTKSELEPYAPPSWFPEGSPKDMLFCVAVRLLIVGLSLALRNPEAFFSNCYSNCY